MEFNSLIDRITGRIPGQTQAIKDLNKIHMSPKAKAAEALRMKNARLKATGIGLGHTVSSLIPRQVYDRVSNEIIRGAQTVFGQDTSYIDSVIKGKPVVKSVGTTDFNIITPEGMRGYAEAMNKAKKAEKDTPDAPEQSPPPAPEVSLVSDPGSSGLDTRTGTKYDSFQEQQTALMNSIAGRYSDPRTAALIRGVPQNPFSSTQLPYTSDNFFTNAEDFDLGIDTSGMLERSKDINYEKLAESVKAGPQTFPLEAGNFIEDYESPVNFNAPKNPVEPMLNPNVDGMTAMRMKDRDLGLMYASGQFFAEGSDGSPVLVNRELAKDVRRGKEGAADQLAAYLAGGGIKPQGGVIYNPPKEDMVPPKAESLSDSTFNSEDYEVMGGDPANSAVLQQGGGVQVDIDSNFDFNSPKTTQLSSLMGQSSGLQHPFSKVLAENGQNQPERVLVVDEERFGSVSSLIDKYGIDEYLRRLDAGEFF